MNYYIAQDIKLLTKQLAKDIKNSKASLFQTTKIITQTKGMNNWLEMEMADQLGIFCNYQFLGLRDLILEVYQLLGGDVQHIFSRNKMTWLLFEILGRAETKENNSELEAYFKTDALLRMELAAKVADLFDQYQVYRPEMIDNWNNESITHFETENEKWQAYLWRALKSTGTAPFLDLSEIKNFILQEIKNPKQAQTLKNKIKEVYLFGLSSFTAFQVAILRQLSTIFQVHVYLTNPAPSIYWQEDETEKISIKKRLKNGDQSLLNDCNPLLLNWGKLTQNSFCLFSKNNDQFYNQSVILDEDSIHPFPETLLGKIQTSIYEHSAQAALISETDLKDKSITIASNYTIKREVESLFNYLVDTIVTSTGSMKVRDILVVVSDIDAYAPYIKGIFSQKIAIAPSNGEEDKKETFAFKFTIADEKITNGQSVVSALNLLMALEYDEITAEQILQLLENKYISSTFGIYDLEFVKKAMNTASMRFGWDNNKENDTYLVGFTNGIKRMLYGALIADENEFDQVIPINISDNNQEFQTIVKLSYFLETLEAHLKQRKEVQSLSNWNLYVQELLDHFITDNNLEKDDLYKNIFFQIKAFKEVEEEMSELIAFPVFRTHFLNNLNNYTATHKYLNTGITFCSPIPFRSLPFKVICGLGLNYDAFPRKDKAADFDLIKQKPQFSDRNINHNDRQLFLDLLMNAQEKLYLSYIGKDIKDNSEKPPSLLIDELLDFIESSCKKEDHASFFKKEYLLKEHPLLSFSTKYNQEKGNFANNYLIQKKEDDHFSPKNVEGVETDKPKLEITLKNLELFCSDAVKYYYTKVLGIYINESESELEDTEKFELNALEKWKYRDELLDRAVQNKSTDLTEMTAIAYLKGDFPLKNLRRKEESEINKDAQKILEYVQSKRAEGIEFKSVEIEGIPGIEISGTLKYVSDDKTLHYLSPSKTKDKYKIKAYLYFLIAKAMDVADTIVYHHKEKAVFGQGLDNYTKEKAIETLVNIIALMEQAQIEFIPYCSEIINSEDEEALIKIIENHLFDGFNFPNQYLKVAYESGQVQFNKYYEDMDKFVGKPALALFK